MAITYESSVLASVPSLDVAHNSVTANPHFQAFLQEFQEVAVDCKQNGRYGITLVHRHANVEKGHRLVDFGRTLQPVPFKDDAEDLYGFPVRPKSLMLDSGTWKPYEYELGHDEDPDPNFLGRVKEIVEQYDIKGAGLRRYSPNDPEELEITGRGGLSIKFPWTPVDNDEYKTTFWGFPQADPLGPPTTYNCQCVDTGAEGKPSHHHIEKN
ncbi:MAG: hypothetical protein M1820_002135 [Bogoriella megaspora]|nr:MAG: hypothetical protein M1820_002135 [Bogoriella megaspora]